MSGTALFTFFFFFFFFFFVHFAASPAGISMFSRDSPYWYGY
jgi:hypothetical protein